MRPLAVSAAVLTVLVLVLPRHGTPSERSSVAANGSSRARSSASVPAVIGRSLGVSLAAYPVGATGPLAGTGVARTTRKAGDGAVFHPASRPTSSLGDPPVQTVTVTLPAITARRANVKQRHRGIRRGWHNAVASAYSARSTGSTRQGCPGAPPLTDSALSVATFLVGCGQRMRVCYRSRCVTVTRTDSGPFSPGRSVDANLGVVHALTGSWDPMRWGVRRVSWRRAR